MSDDIDWKYEIDTAQRSGTTGQTLERRHGAVSSPEPTDDNEADESDGEDGSDSFNIPVQFKND